MKRWWNQEDYDCYQFYLWMTFDQQKLGNLDKCIEDILLQDYVSLKEKCNNGLSESDWDTVFTD